MRNQTIPNQSNFVRKGEKTNQHIMEFPCQTEIQPPKIDELNSERQIIREKSQSKEINGLDSKYLERQALREPSLDRYDDQRLGKHVCDERLKNPKFTGYFCCVIQISYKRIISISI